MEWMVIGIAIVVLAGFLFAWITKTNHAPIGGIGRKVDESQ